MPTWLAAGLWGLLAGGALVIGAAIAWNVNVSQRVVAGIMAFGSGVLISALSFDLVDEAIAIGGLAPTLGGFLAGALVYVSANQVLAARGARHRKRSENQQADASEPGSGTAIAVGALLDGVPESVVLGISLIGGHGVGLPVLAAIFLSNLPEGLSSAAGMKKSGRSARYVFGVWIGIAIMTGLAGMAGFLLLQGATPEVIAAITAVAAGAILAMIADTMLPEAFEGTHMYSGLITTLGFALALTVSRM